MDGVCVCVYTYVSVSDVCLFCASRAHTHTHTNLVCSEQERQQWIESMSLQNRNLMSFEEETDSSLTWGKSSLGSYMNWQKYNLLQENLHDVC